MTLLRQVDPSLTGSGVAVAQPESPGGANDFEVNPAATGQPEGLFTWISASGTANSFPNAVGTESGHANSVGNNFYGAFNGAAPGISHVYNYEADHFYNSLIAVPSPTNIPARIINQSFIFGVQSSSIDQNYDDFAAQFNTVFVSGAGNGGAVSSPGTAYNGLAVGVYGANSSVGPTTDGRCKPDITAPGGATSFSTPYVSGSAAILVQAGNRGDAGTNVTAATDARTIKAFLLNGAVKPSDWTNSPTRPMDLRYGAGIVNAFNSWKQLTAGKQAFVEGTSHASGGAHAPGSNTNNVASRGWDFNSIVNVKSGPNYLDRVHHYYFNVPATTNNSFTFTASLVWNRNVGQSSINDLNLFLYDAATGALVASSTSSVDNVEHIFRPSLPPGRYDLQVLKSASGVNTSTTTEVYSIAFEAFNVRLSIARSNNNMVVSWPIAPTGFVLQAATNLTSPTWSNVGSPVSVISNQNSVTLPATDTQRFFRLQRP